MNGNSNRKRKRLLIESLAPEVREKIDEMIKGNYTYAQIVEYIKSTGNKVSSSAVQRYATSLMNSVQALSLIQESLKAIQEETDKEINLDVSEPILRMASSKLLEMISLPRDEKMDVNKLIKNAIELTKAMAYKKKIELESKTTLEIGMEECKRMFYETFGLDNPELYQQLIDYMDEKFKEWQSNDTNN